MCWALFLAVPGFELPPITRTDEDDLFGAWRTPNESVHAIGEDYASWMVGDARHCSCARVSRDSQTDRFTLDDRAAVFIADTADLAGHVLVALNWMSGNPEDVELGPDIQSSVSAATLKNKHRPMFSIKSFIWVEGQHEP